ncbi:Molybdopterin synthase catalytic subunit [Bienertia sinuspersici]
MKATILLPLFLTIVVLSLINHHTKWIVEVEAITIPAKPDGFVHGNPKKYNPERILIEAFFDPLCSDTRDSWPPLKHALQYYGSNVSLIVHTFPLPYHSNAFTASRAIHIVNELNSSATFPLWESFFKHQEKFLETSNLTQTEIVDLIAKFATKSVGHAHYSAVKSGLLDTKFDLKTRVSFKYASSRGVFGTPSFFLNGFPLPDGESPIKYNEWRKTIDPLIHSKGE